MAWLFPNFQCKVSSAGKARAHCVIGNANVAGVSGGASTEVAEVGFGVRVGVEVARDLCCAYLVC